MVSESIPHVVTPAADCDAPFILDSWRRSYRNSPAGTRLPREVYDVRQSRLMSRLLSQSDVRVARPRDWPEGVFGWACAEELGDTFVLHYAFTKSHYRNHGILSGILATYDLRGRRKVFTQLRPPYTDHLRNMGFALAPHYASAKFGDNNG